MKIDGISDSGSAIVCVDSSFSATIYNLILQVIYLLFSGAYRYSTIDDIKIVRASELTLPMWSEYNLR